MEWATHAVEPSGYGLSESCWGARGRLLTEPGEAFLTHTMLERRRCITRNTRPAGARQMQQVVLRQCPTLYPRPGEAHCVAPRQIVTALGRRGVVCILAELLKDLTGRATLSL